MLQESNWVSNDLPAAKIAERLEWLKAEMGVRGQAELKNGNENDQSLALLYRRELTDILSPGTEPRHLTTLDHYPVYQANSAIIKLYPTKALEQSEFRDLARFRYHTPQSKINSWSDTPVFTHPEEAALRAARHELIARIRASRNIVDKELEAIFPLPAILTHRNRFVGMIINEGASEVQGVYHMARVRDKATLATIRKAREHLKKQDLTYNSSLVKLFPPASLMIGKNDRLVGLAQLFYYID